MGNLFQTDVESLQIHPSRVHLHTGTRVHNYPGKRVAVENRDEPVAANIRFMIQGYRGDRTRQLKLWRSVEIETRQWQKDYDIMQRQTGGKPALAFRDGGRFIIIDQHLPMQAAARHRLTGFSAEIYRFCLTPRTLKQVAGMFVAHSPEQIRAFF